MFACSSRLLFVFFALWLAGAATAVLFFPRRLHPPLFPAARAPCLVRVSHLGLAAAFALWLVGERVAT